MEDSGIESDEKLFGTKNMNDILCSTNESMNHLTTFPSTTVIEKNYCLKPKKPVTAACEKINTTPNNDRLNSYRVLQRKLEIKAEKAKKNFSRVHDIDELEKRSSSTLISISRLNIPNRPETQPLVDYNSEKSDDDDHPFFPVKLNNNKKVDITDTFSLQEMEMTIESNSDEDDSTQNLELRFSDPNEGWLYKVKRWSCCL
ncbi:uncharacterized protein LOC134835690 [Culicoides brevitarsis]|uniref:uncharacterized protein LOC134835690 n=1 Tax=Culicoides brevitarsis TaxID=469753 RepID=UPI00307C0682